MARSFSRRWTLSAAAMFLPAMPTIVRAQEKIILRMGTLGTVEYVYYQAAMRMAEEVQKNSDGRITIQVFPNQQLGNERDMIEGMQLGTIDLAIVNTPLLAGFDARFMIFDMPFLFDNWAHANRAMNAEIGQNLLNALEAKSLKGLAYSTAGFRQVLNHKRVVRTPEDLKGLKIRVLDNPVHVAIMNAMGANATPMQYGEVATALRQRTVDGLDFTIVGTLPEKLYETEKFMSLTGHVFTGVVFLMSLKRYQSLPDDLRKVILAGGKVGAERETELHNGLEADGIEKLRKLHGMQIDEVDKVAFRSRMQPVFDRFQDRVGKDLIGAVKKLGS